MRRFMTGFLLLLHGVAFAASGLVILDPALEFEEVVSGLDLPTTMAFIGPDDILVLQKNDGRVLRVSGGAIQGTVLDLAVDGFSERGLLGIAVDPDFVHNGWVYLYYTPSSTGDDVVEAPDPNPQGNLLARFRWNGATLVEPVTLLDLPSLGSGPHNAGPLAFGPDDWLYAQIGDHGQCCPNVQLQNNPTGSPPNRPTTRG